jgi:hypothetical protein
LGPRWVRSRYLGVPSSIALLTIVMLPCLGTLICWCECREVRFGGVGGVVGRVVDCQAARAHARSAVRTPHNATRSAAHLTASPGTAPQRQSNTHKHTNKHKNKHANKHTNKHANTQTSTQDSHVFLPRRKKKNNHLGQGDVPGLLGAQAAEVNDLGDALVARGNVDLFFCVCLCCVFCVRSLCVCVWSRTVVGGWLCGGEEGMQQRKPCTAQLPLACCPWPCRSSCCQMSPTAHHCHHTHRCNSMSLQHVTRHTRHA